MFLQNLRTLWCCQELLCCCLLFAAKVRKLLIDAEAQAVEGECRLPNEQNEAHHWLTEGCVTGCPSFARGGGM